MEHWRDSSILRSNAPALDDNRRILRDTSGNIQSYSLKTETGLENVHPYQHHGLDISAHKLYPPTYHPAPILSSNDRDSNLLRLHERRQRHDRKDFIKNAQGKSQGRSYLHCKKYLDYRARQRRDTGADGEPVWSDDVEDAFQDGKLVFPLLQFTLD